MNAIKLLNLYKINWLFRQKEVKIVWMVHKINVIVCWPIKQNNVFVKCKNVKMNLKA
jgi:hypothetical protein